MFLKMEMRGSWLLDDASPMQPPWRLLMSGTDDLTGTVQHTIEILNAWDE